MTDAAKLTAGIDFDWKHIAGYFMCIQTFKPMAQILGDKVGSPKDKKFENRKSLNLALSKLKKSLT